MFQFFRAICVILAVLSLIGTCYDGLQRFSSEPYNKLNEDIQGVEFEQKKSNDNLVKEDNIETMRIQLVTRRRTCYIFNIK